MPRKQQSDVVARKTFVQQLAEHFHARHNFLLRRTETHDLDFFANLHLAALDASRNHRAAARDRENVFDRHRERLIDVAHRLRYVLVDRFHQVVDRLFPLGVAVQRLQRLPRTIAIVSPGN